MQVAGTSCLDDGSSGDLPGDGNGRACVAREVWGLGGEEGVRVVAQMIALTARVRAQVMPDV